MLTQDAKRLGLHPKSTREQKAEAKKRAVQKANKNRK